MADFQKELDEIFFDYRLNVSYAEQSQGGDGDLEAVERAKNQAIKAINNLLSDVIGEGESGTIMAQEAWFEGREQLRTSLRSKLGLTGGSDEGN